MEKKNVIKFIDTFHDLEVISDSDCIKVKNHFVLEAISSNKIVCNFYDKQGVSLQPLLTFDLLDICIITESRDEDIIISIILKVIGTNKIYISDSAVKLIKSISN